ncbi:MAG: hypothetical protein JXQ73_17710 [Phycisphaerae bacterium]|nr:hypothetical protein [Phycisphaerae bacterium]
MRSITRLFGCMVMCALMLGVGGCFIPVTDVPADGDDPVVERALFQGTVYLIGQAFDDELFDDLQVQIDFQDYDGQAADAPVAIDGEAVADLTAQQIEGLEATLDAGFALILIDATEEQIDALRALIGDEMPDFTMPDGITVAEVYAVDVEPDGSIFQWVQYPPAYDAESDQSDGQAPQISRANLLVQWLTENGARQDAEAAQQAKTAANMAAANNDLVTSSSAFVNQSNFTKEKNNYQLAHYIYTCHSNDSGDDWFYVQQQCVFSGSGAYRGHGAHVWIASMVNFVRWYMRTIDVDAWMSGTESKPQQAGMMQSSPETINNTETVTSGVSWNISGKVTVGAEKDGVKTGAEFGSGLSISHSKSVVVRDCEVINKSNDRGSNAHWLYTFKRPAAQAGAHPLTHPPSLSVGTFQPLNQWIWRLSPQLRQDKTPMKVRLNVALGGSWAISGGFIYPLAFEYPNMDGGNWTFDVNIPYPPTSAQ